jgi:hypothetical protein
MMLLSLPFALQASALMAENCVVPFLVIFTIKAHAANFRLELDQYLTTVAINKGSLASSTTVEALELGGSLGVSRGGTGKLKRQRAQELLRDKMAMARDVSLSWRIGKFVKEVGSDCTVINKSVALMVLNFACHLVPLNTYLFDPSSCLPLWCPLFLAAQSLALFLVVRGGVEANEMINEGLDQMLHEWQLKFNMIGWSGGFMQESEDGEEVVGFMTKDPPGETEDDIRKAVEGGEADFGAIVRAEQNNRIMSIVKVLQHYEAEVLEPFSVLGITVTRSMLTMVIGFFGGSIVG